MKDKYYRTRKKHKKKLIKLIKSTDIPLYDFDFLHDLVVTQLENMGEYYKADPFNLNSDEKKAEFRKIFHALFVERDNIDKLIAQGASIYSPLTQDAYKYFYKILGDNITKLWD